MTLLMCALPRCTAISARRRISRPRSPNWPARTSRRRLQLGASEGASDADSRGACVTAEIVAVLDPQVEVLPLGRGRPEGGVDVFRDLIIRIGPAADEG